MSDSKSLTEAIATGDKDAFEKAFHLYYSSLYNLAKALLRNHELAEEQTQEVFIKLWEKRDNLKSDVNLLPYLLTSIRNRCYNYIRDQKVFEKHLTEQQRLYQEQVFDHDNENIDEELINRINAAIKLLPERCQEVFKLSRFSGLNHKQISEKLAISTKTVENHITKAMKVIKSEVSYIVLMMLIIGEINNLSVFI